MEVDTHKYDKSTGKGRLVTVVLEGACLDSVRTKTGYSLLNCDDHIGIMKKMGIDMVDARPDITHQCLMSLMDSPLNKAGLLRVYIHTKKNVLIEIHPQTRIPRTFKRFSGLFVQLLQQLKIRATDGPDHLLKVIKNPVTDHLPVGSQKIGFSYSASKCVDIMDFVAELPDDKPIVFVIGAFAEGKIDIDYVEEEIAISKYPLSGSVVCGKICNAFERKWEIL